MYDYYDDDVTVMTVIVNINNRDDYVNDYDKRR
jgi:hypothetical protein